MGETEESLDLAINLTAMCGRLCIGAYHTGGKRLVDVQQLNIKAIDCLSTHPRENDLMLQMMRGEIELCILKAPFGSSDVQSRQ